MGKALYRKYRPISLSTVVGQDSVIKPLSEAIKSGNFSHAYIFTGPRGCGKTSVARIFAHEINNFKYELEDSYLDIIEIDAASNTGVDNIRELREKAMIAPTEGKYKVYIIDEVHMLSKSAFNALLKIMEEPPEHVIFILATTNPEKVPVTILSRAQLYTFSLADPDTMFNHLRKISDSEHIKIDDDALKIIVERGGGSFRDSISLLDQMSNLKSKDETITVKDIDSALGLPESKKIDHLLQNFENGAETTPILKELLNSGAAPESIAQNIIDRIINHPTPKTLALIDKLFTVHYPFAEAKLLVAFLETEKYRFESVPPTAAPVTMIGDEKKRAEFVKKIEQSKREIKQRIEADKENEEKSEIKTATLDESLVQGGSLNLEAFIRDIKERHRGIGNTVEKSFFVLEEKELKVYPPKHLVGVLKRNNNLKLLKEAAPNYYVHIIDTNETDPPKDAITFAKQEKKPEISAKMQKNIDAISDIMGGDIKEDDNAPF